MKYKVVISQKASLDYARVKHHYKSIDNDLELRFKTEVKKILVELENHPELFQQIKHNQRRAVIGSSFPHKLYYEVDSEAKTVRVVGIFHERQQPEKIKEEFQLEQLQQIQDQKQKRYIERMKGLEQIRENRLLEQDRERDLGLGL